MTTEDIKAAIIRQPGAVEKIRSNFVAKGFPGAAYLTDAEILAAWINTYNINQVAAAAVFPFEFFQAGANQKGEFGSFLSTLGNTLTTTVGAAGNIVGAIGTNAQANAANAQAVAAYNQALASAAGGSGRTDADTAAAAAKKKKALMIGGIILGLVILAVVLYLIFRSKKG